MKALIAVAGGAATADREGPWQDPDLSNSFDGYWVSRTSSVQDPLEESYPGNGDLYSDDASGGTHYDCFVRGNPDIKVCGCI